MFRANRSHLILAIVAAASLVGVTAIARDGGGSSSARISGVPTPTKGTLVSLPGFVRLAWRCDDDGRFATRLTASGTTGVRVSLPERRPPWRSQLVKAGRTVQVETAAETELHWRITQRAPSGTSRALITVAYEIRPQTRTCVPRRLAVTRSVASTAR